MKNSVLIGSAACLIFGRIVASKNEKIKNMLTQAFKEGMATDTAQEILELAKETTIKELHSKLTSKPTKYKPSVSFVARSFSV